MTKIGTLVRLENLNAATGNVVRLAGIVAGVHRYSKHSRVGASRCVTDWRCLSDIIYTDPARD